MVDVLPIKSLTQYFVKNEIINFDEEEIIQQTVGRSEAARIVLRKIGGSLKACSHYESNAYWRRINSHCLRSH